MVEKRDIEIIVNNPIDWEKFRNKTVLITGATGRLGIYIVETLCDINIKWNLNITVLAVARSKKKAESLFKDTIKLPFVHLIIQDITTPIIWDGNINYIFHLAGLASPYDFTNMPVDTLWGHVQGTHNILELARLKLSEKVFYASTVEIYGSWNYDKLLAESDMGILDCNSTRACYPEAKRLCETMFACYKSQYNVDYVGIRMSHTFGPGISLDDGRAFAEFIRNVLEGKDIVLYTDGSAIRTYTYVADAIGAIFIAFTKGNESFYNVAANENEISVRNLANLIVDLDPNKKSKVVISGKNENNLSYLPFRLGIMDTSEIRNLGWKPKVNIQDAFRWTFESFYNVKIGL